MEKKWKGLCQTPRKLKGWSPLVYTSRGVGIACMMKLFLDADWTPATLLHPANSAKPLSSANE